MARDEEERALSIRNLSIDQTLGIALFLSFPKSSVKGDSISNSLNSHHASPLPLSMADKEPPLLTEFLYQRKSKLNQFRCFLAPQTFSIPMQRKRIQDILWDLNLI